MGSPGNAVLALARYWPDNATLIAQVEERYPGRVYRAAGAGPAPGAAQICFSAERERFGPADHKIWATSGISADSVGRGESVPAGLIVPQVTGAINELAGKLGYLDVPGSGTLAGVLRSRVEGAGEQFASRWESCLGEQFLVVSRTAGGIRAEAQWLVDLAAATAAEHDHQADGDEGQAGVDDQAGDVDDDGPVWSILGSPRGWQAVLDGQVNLQAALRRCDLRYYCTTDEDSALLCQTRVAMLADLLGLSSWLQPGAFGQDGVAGQDAAGQGAATVVAAR